MFKSESLTSKEQPTNKNIEANSVKKEHHSDRSILHLVDNRPSSDSQRELKQKVYKSPQISQLKTYQHLHKNRNEATQQSQLPLPKISKKSISNIVQRKLVSSESKKNESNPYINLDSLEYIRLYDLALKVCGTESKDLIIDALDAYCNSNTVFIFQTDAEFAQDIKGRVNNIEITRREADLSILKLQENCKSKIELGVDKAIGRVHNALQKVTSNGILEGADSGEIEIFKGNLTKILLFLQTHAKNMTMVFPTLPNGALGSSMPGTGQIKLSQSALDQKDIGLADTIIHEASHAILSTEDIAYRWQEGFNKLLVNQHLRNADSYSVIVNFLN